MLDPFFFLILILYLYSEKCIKFNQSESRIRSRKIWNFARHLRYTETGETLSFKKTGLWFFWTIYKKEWIKQEIKSAHIGYSDKAVGIKGIPF